MRKVLLKCLPNNYKVPGIAYMCCATTMSQEYAKYAQDNSQLITFTFLSPKIIESYYDNSPELRKAKLVYESVSEDLHASLMKDAAYNAKYNSRYKKRSFVETEDEYNQEVKKLPWLILKLIVYGRGSDSFKLFTIVL
jgi:hypothetical protein